MLFARITNTPGRNSVGSVAALIGVVSVGAIAGSAEARESGGESRPQVAAVTWGACGWRTSEQKVVRTFTRVRGDDGAGHFLRGGDSRLLCGTERYGYRHIFMGHMGEWEGDARIGGTNWRDHADWSIDVVLKDPDAVSYRLNNDGSSNYCYSRAIELWDVGHRRHVKDRIIKVVVKGDTADIITAFPNDRQC